MPVASYSYDAAGNLTRVTHADLSFETHNYEPTGLKRLVSVTDENGNTEASWTYSGGDAIGYARAGGVDAVTISNLGGGKYLVTDAIGNSTTYTSTKYRLGSSPFARSRITEVSGPGCESCPGGVVKATYDRYPARRPQWVKDRNGVVTVFADYDERDLPGRVISDAGGPNEREVSYTYHPAFGRVLEKSEESVLRAGGLKTTIYDYDDDGDGVPNENPTRLVRRLIERGYTRDLAGGVVPYEEITRYDYNSHGQVVAVDGPLGGSADTVTLTYDPASGYLTSRTDPIIGTTTYADHDLYGNPRLVVDPNGNATATEYDARGRMIGSTDVSTKATTQWVRDGKGRLLELRLPAPGRVIYHSYDEADRLTAIADGLGNEIRYSYDLAGNPVREEVRDPQGSLARYQDFAYNAPQGDGRLSRIFNPDGSYTEYGYDPNGNITSVVDSQGRTVSYSHDSRNVLAGMTEDAGGIAAQTSYEYDQQGNLREVTDAEGRVTAYEYDDGGRLLAVSSADTGTTSYRYDGAGNLMAKSDSSGAMVSYSYDALGRVAGIDYLQDELDVSYTYDEGQNGKGRLTGRVDAGGATAWSFDPLGRVVAVSRETAGVVSTVSYEYDLEGNLVGIGYPSGLELRYSYDDAARVVGVERMVGGQAFALASGIDYLPLGPVKALTYANGLTETRSYDELYRLRALDSGGIVSRRYGYDPRGNITSISDLLEPQKSLEFSYDGLNRLTEAGGGFGLRRYEYDRTGNRLSESDASVVTPYAYVPGTNMLASVGEDAYSHDNRGNVTQAGPLSFIYDASGRLAEAVGLGSYWYSADGLRAQKLLSDGSSIIYIYDEEGRLLEEVDGFGRVVKDYVYPNGVPFATVSYGGDGGVDPRGKVKVRGDAGRGLLVKGKVELLEGVVNVSRVRGLAVRVRFGGGEEVFGATEVKLNRRGSRLTTLLGDRGKVRLTSGKATVRVEAPGEFGVPGDGEVEFCVVTDGGGLCWGSRGGKWGERLLGFAGAGA